MSNMDDVYKSLAKQDIQHKLFTEAQELVKNGDVQKGIQILEKIMYEDGLVMRGVGWPFVLAKTYYANKMYNKCWVYLNFLQAKRIGDESKILELQSKIRNAEKKYKDTLYLKLLSLYKKYESYIDVPTEDMIYKEINPIIKKFGDANTVDKYIKMLLASLKDKAIDIGMLKHEIQKEQM